MLKNDSGNALEKFGVKVVQIPSSDGSASGSTSNASGGEAEATTSKNKSYSTTETSECKTSPYGAKSKSSSTIWAVQASQILLVTSLLLTKKKYRK